MFPTFCSFIMSARLVQHAGKEYLSMQSKAARSIMRVLG